MRRYYNENDPATAFWLRSLMAAGLIPQGDVDERSIADVQATDLAGYDQCHFFAGIGGWPEALRLADWPAARPVWTGSCPCQPFSVAGKRKGAGDERHLWPVWFRLIQERRPECILGEQVEGAVRLGWLDGVFTDLEAEGYACGAVVLGAHSVGAPHIRQRLWWVADADGRKLRDGGLQRGGKHRQQPQDGYAVGGLANAEGRGFGIDGGASGSSGHADQRNKAGGVAESERAERRTASRLGFDVLDRQETERAEGTSGPELHGGDGGLADAASPRFEGWLQRRQGPEGESEHGHAGCGRASFWSDHALIPCADGKARRIEPGLAPLAHGVPGRVAQLRGLGNAICPQVAAAFVTAWMDGLATAGKGE